MKTQLLEKFAQQLIEHVRDVSIRNCDAMLSPSANSPIAQRWRRAGCAPSVVATIIPDIVDETIFALLHAIDTGELRLSFSSEGAQIDLTDDGMAELAGSYVGGEWRASFSKERYVDDLEDMDA